MTQSQSPKVTEDPMDCPLCMEPLEIDDVNFFPCTCGYQICRFCWHHIRSEKGLCPTCRKPYTEDPAVYKPLSKEELQRIKNEKKQKQNEKKQKITETRKHLSNVRVIQKNLVFVLGLSQRLADPKVLKRPNYFGKFGKITTLKVMTNNTSYAGSQGPIASAYVTYSRSEDALRAIQCVNNEKVDGRILKASLGTTKYCSYFLKSMPCPKPDCTYLHELGDEDATFTKEEIQAGKHEEYKQKLLQDLLKINPTFLQTTSATGLDKPKGKSNSLQSSKSTNKVAWLSLTPTDTTADDGLSLEHRKSPPLDGSSDSEYVTPDRPDSDLGLISPISPLSSKTCEPTSPNDKLPDIIGIGNGESSQLLLGCDSPSPPPDHTNSSLPVAISVAGLKARSPFVRTVAESQSLFSDSFRQPNNIPSGLVGFHSSPPNHSDWPTTPEPQRSFNSSSIPVSPSTCLAPRSHFDGLAAESQSLFSDIFMHPNNIPSGLADFPSSQQRDQHSDWPPEPQRPFTSDSIPVSSSTEDWEAAFGFASPKQQQQQEGDDRSFEELAKLQKKLSVQDNFPSLSPGPLPPRHLHSHPLPSVPTKGGLGPCGSLLPPNYFPNHFYSAYGYPSSYSPSANSSYSATHQHWMGVAGPASAHSNLAQSKHTDFDLSLLQGHHSTGLISQVVKPPPGFLRPPGQSQTDLRQSATIDRN